MLKKRRKMRLNFSNVAIRAKLEIIGVHDVSSSIARMRYRRRAAAKMTSTCVRRLNTSSPPCIRLTGRRRWYSNTSQTIPLWFPSCFDSRFRFRFDFHGTPFPVSQIPKAISSCFDSRFQKRFKLGPTSDSRSQVRYLEPMAGPLFDLVSKPAFGPGSGFKELYSTPGKKLPFWSNEGLYHEIFFLILETRCKI